MGSMKIPRRHGLRVVIWPNDHTPALKAEGEVKIDLNGPKGLPTIVEYDGMSRADLRNALELVTEYQALLLAEWKRIHG